MQMQALHNQYGFHTHFSKIYSIQKRHRNWHPFKLYIWNGAKPFLSFYMNAILTLAAQDTYWQKKNTAGRCNTQGCCNFYISKQILTAEPKWAQTELNWAPFLKTSQTKVFCLKNVNDILILAAQDTFKHIEKPQAAATVSDSAILTFIWTNLIFVYKIYIS
jgi:hypothetical protein